MIGTILQNRYRIDANLGQGSTGTVFRVIDLLLDHQVAIKVLSAVSWVDEDQSLFIKEAHANARLNHPNITCVYNAGEAEGIPFIVMELVDGHSLHESPPRSLNETIQYGIQICAALEYAHAHNVVHRDLKPENVLITENSIAKLGG